MQLDENKVTEIFFILDEFSKNFNKTIKKHSVGDGKRHRNKPNRLSDAEVMLILIMFHDGGYRCLKHYYANYICVHCKQGIYRERTVLTMRINSLCFSNFLYRTHVNNTISVI